MIERLQRALEHIEDLSPEAQEELAQQIETMSAPLPDLTTPGGPPADAALPRSVQVALALGGAWSDLQDDDEFAFFDHIRHEVAPTPPMDEQLAWLDDEQ